MDPWTWCKDTQGCLWATLGAPRAMWALPTGQHECCCWRLTWVWKTNKTNNTYLSSKVLLPTSAMTYTSAVSIRLFIKLRKLQLPLQMQQHISNSEWVFYSPSWGSNKGVRGLTYPLADSFMWPKCPVLQGLGNVLGHFMWPVGWVWESRAHCLDKQTLQVSWAEEWRQSQIVLRRAETKGTFGLNTCLCHLRKLPPRSHSPMPLTHLALQRVPST